MPKAKVIELSGQKYNAEWLRGVPLSKAIAVLKNNHDKNQVTNAWKQSNGLSVRDYTKEVEVIVPVKKKAAAKKKPAK